jgi:hypothetical protein
MMRLIGGIDTAMPDIRNRWSYHAAWNQNDRLWREDFTQLAECGFDLLRWQMPWSLVQPAPNEYRWDLIDEKVELATKLGLEIFYPVVHFNYPTWIAGRGERHAVYSRALPDRLAEYTDKLLSRYHFRLVIPVVEVQMEAFQRGRAGNWQPHQKSRTAYRVMRENVLRAFRASAAVAHAHGATVFCSEPASEIETVRALRDSIDIAGIDLYPHMHRKWSVLGYLQRWWQEIQLPLCLSEFGTPETYDPGSKQDQCDLFYAAGTDSNRVAQARALREALEEARDQGIPIPFGGWYPGTGNIGWGLALTQERAGLDCDRAGLIDLARQPDGSLKRVLCADLLREVLGMRDLTPVPVRLVTDTVPAPNLEPLPTEVPAALLAELPPSPSLGANGD